MARKKAIKLRRNPVPRGRLAKTEKCISLYQRFRNQDPAYIDEFDAPDMSVCMLIGKCDAIEYTTIRGGKTELYRHEFTGKSRPMLIASWDGKQVGFLGGRYSFSEVGIKDH